MSALKAFSNFVGANKIGQSAVKTVLADKFKKQQLLQFQEF